MGMRHFLLALQYFTRIPLPARLAAWVGFSPAMLRAALAHLPGVGWIVGAFSALVLLLAHWLLSGADTAAAISVAVLAVAASIMLTGAFHEDGLADVGDALGGFVPRDRALQIMKDSRLGSYGVITIVLALLLRISLLASLLRVDVALAACALLSAQVLSRWAPLFLGQWLPYVGGKAASGNDAAHDDAAGREELTSKARPMMVGEGESRSLLVGSLWALPALLLAGACLGSGTLVALLVGGGLVTWQLGLFFRRRLGGITGDCLGSTQQVVELGCYFIMVAGLRWVDVARL